MTNCISELNYKYTIEYILDILYIRFLYYAIYVV